ncbi:MAG: hypothetical protein LBG58_09180 [Planctomycetaceae bacterium]|jgi:hypothetical protein|nr:hypothetical protein [Planctomycetaceae bacterium]
MMPNLPVVLYRKTQFLIYWGVFVFVMPFLHAQDLGWNGYRSQGSNGEWSTAIPANQENTSRFYLLRTGFLTEGTAANDGKQYLLKTNFGTMSVPVANVEFVGTTREDVYHYKRGTVNSKDCNDLIKLAEWCLNNKLQQQGIAEYQRALQTAPNSLLADVIRKRLEMLHDSETRLPNGLSNIRTVLASSSGESGDTGITRWVNGIPKPIVDSFAKKVQPVLISRCAAADCHGSVSENQFKLSIPSHTLGNTTYRNLRSVLQWIDLDYPAESQLLSVLVSYHGGAKAAFSVESTQYNNIVQWVRLAAKELPTEYRSQIAAHKNDDVQTDKKESELPLKGEVLPPALREAMIVNHPVSKTNQPETPTAFLVPSNSDSIPAGTFSALPSNYMATRLNSSDFLSNPSNSSNLTTSTSLDLPPTDDFSQNKDPFDPRIFNSRYHVK